MRAFFAIVRHTCRSAFRSRLFLFLLILMLAVLFLVPLSVQYDGTGIGMVQVTLEYSFGLMAFFLCVSSVWLVCQELTHDVANAHIHMIVSKPVSRVTVFFAKLTGTLAIHAFLLVILSAAIYALLAFRVSRHEFLNAENDTRERLDREVFTARRLYKPEEKDIDSIVEDRLDRELKAAKARGEEMPKEWETVRDENGEHSRAEIVKRLRDFYSSRENSVAPGETHFWTYDGLPDDLSEPFFIRSRFMSGTSESIQSAAAGQWGWRYWFPGQGGKDDAAVPRDVPVSGGSMKSLMINENMIPGAQDGILMVKDGKGTLVFQNLDPKATMLFRPQDGPFLMIPRTSFAVNYMRAVLTVFLEIVSVTVIASAFAAIFTLASSIFITFSYILLSQAAQFILELFASTGTRPHGILEYQGILLSKGVRVLLVDPGNFSVSDQLASGMLIEWNWIGSVFLFDVFLRAIPFLALGVLFYSRRELALAAKE